MNNIATYLLFVYLGYWSDDAYEGTFFGKLYWDQDDPTTGKILCSDAGEMKTAYVKRYLVIFSKQGVYFICIMNRYVFYHWHVA